MQTYEQVIKRRIFSIALVLYAITTTILLVSQLAINLELEKKLSKPAKTGIIEYPAKVIAIESDPDYEVATYQVIDINDSVSYFRDQYGLFGEGDIIRPETQDNKPK